MSSSQSVDQSKLGVVEILSKSRIEAVEDIGKGLFAGALNLFAESNSQIMSSLQNINIFDKDFSVGKITATFQDKLGDLGQSYIRNAYELFNIGNVIKKEIEQIKQEGEEFDREVVVKKISKSVEQALSTNAYQLLKQGGLPSGLTSAFISSLRSSLQSTPSDSVTGSAAISRDEGNFMDLLGSPLQKAVDKNFAIAVPLLAVSTLTSGVDGGATLAAAGALVAQGVASDMAVSAAAPVVRPVITDIRKELLDNLKHLVESQLLVINTIPMSSGIELERSQSERSGASPENSSRRSSIDLASESETAPLLGYDPKTKTSMSCLGCFPVMHSISNAISNAMNKIGNKVSSFGNAVSSFGANLFRSSKSKVSPVNLSQDSPSLSGVPSSSPSEPSLVRGIGRGSARGG